MIIIYHDDADGKTAARQVFLRNKVKDNTGRVKLIKMSQHNVEIDLDDLVAGEVIYIVDYSINPKQMLTLLDKTENVFWIDHHKSVIESKYKDFPREIKGLRLDGVSGALLTYCYLTNNELQVKNKFNGTSDDFRNRYVDRGTTPMYLQLVDDWDVHRLLLGMRTKYIVMIFDTYDFNITDDLAWNELEDPTLLGKLINRGSIMYTYKSKVDENTVKENAYEVELEGKKILVCNTTSRSSELFNSVKDDKYDGYIIYYWNKDKWKFHLYSEDDKPSVVEIAQKYGGGGHPHACGFRCDKLPWLK